MTISSPTRASAPYRVAVVGVAAAMADVAFDPVHRHVPLCPFHAVTGWWCPLCGGLRAADSLVHGQIGAALQYNVLFAAALPLVLFWWLDWLRSGRVRRMPRATVIALIAFVVAFTVLRNLPFAAMLRGG